jgi:hypothetical protein
MYAAELTYSDGVGDWRFYESSLAAHQGGHTSSESLPPASRSVISKIFLFYSFTRRVFSTPIIACAHAIFSNEEVL